MPTILDRDAALKILACRPGLRDVRDIVQLIADVRLEDDQDRSILVTESRMMFAHRLWWQAGIVDCMASTRIAVEKRVCTWVAAEAAHLPQFVFGFVFVECHGVLAFGFFFGSP
jgi:hypothetical protein